MKHILIRDWMTPKPVTADIHTTLPEAHKLMTQNRIRRLPVMDRDKLVGIVTRGTFAAQNPQKPPA